MCQESPWILSNKWPMNKFLLFLMKKLGWDFWTIFFGRDFLDVTFWTRFSYLHTRLFGQDYWTGFFGLFFNAYSIINPKHQRKHSSKQFRKLNEELNTTGTRSRVKVEKILKGSLDSISSPSPSVKIQIIGGKFYLTY